MPDGRLLKPYESIGVAGLSGTRAGMEHRALVLHVAKLWSTSVCCPQHVGSKYLLDEVGSEFVLT